MSKEVENRNGAAESAEQGSVDRREFLKKCGLAAPVIFGLVRLPTLEAFQSGVLRYDATEHLYGMGIDVSKCIGCGQCVAACKIENDVPLDAHHFNTWVERYIVGLDGEVEVDSPNGGMDGFPPAEAEIDSMKSFFVPRLTRTRHRQ